MTDVFDQTNTTEVAPSFEDLVGEGKKYKTTEDLVKAYAHSQSHIKTLETERAEDRAKISAQKTIDEVLDQIATRTSGNQRQDPPNTNSDPNDDAKLAEKIDALLARRRQEDSAQTNMQQVASSLGNNAGEQLRAKADELGMSYDMIKSMAASSPKAVLALFNQPQPRTSQPQIQVGNKLPTGVNPNTPMEVDGHKTMAYYRKLRETEGVKKYLLPDVQLQMSKDAQALGSKFY